MAVNLQLFWHFLKQPHNNIVILGIVYTFTAENIFIFSGTKRNNDTFYVLLATTVFLAIAEITTKITIISTQNAATITSGAKYC